MSRTLEVASPAWMAAIAATIKEEVAGLDTQGVTYTVGEAFIGIPAHLAEGGDRDFKWHARFSNGLVEVGRGIPKDADTVTSMTYETAKRLGQLVYADDPAATAEKDLIIAEAFQSGTMTH